MGKVICEVCGTSYPETAPQCPICGYVNPKNAENAMGDSTAESRNGEYHYVKGGRFSKSNVKKRNQGKLPPVRNTTTSKMSSSKGHSSHGHDNGRKNIPVQDGGERKRSTGMIVASVLLVLAIIAVVVYLSIQFLGPNGKIPDVTLPATTEATAVETTISQVSCERIVLSTEQITFDKIDASRMIYVKTSPESVADTIVFKSSNEKVATVNQVGMITAVGSGEAVITVTCGNVSAQCVVSCTADDSEETTAPTETKETTEVIEEEFKLNRKDITFSRKGESWILYDGKIGKTQIAFSSDDTSVAVFEGGTVKAVGGGITTVHAEFKGKKVSCIIRCNFASDSGIEGNGGGVSEEGSQHPENREYKVYSQFGGPVNDVTIKVGEVVNLTLKNSNGETANTSWSVSGVGVSQNGSSFRGVSSGQCSVSTTYNGHTYTCIIRVN